MTSAGVDAEPLLEQRRVDAAEVGGRLDVAVAVEAVLQAGELADHLPLRARADQEADAGGAVVGACVAVLLGAPPELRPDVHEHAVGEAARLEVALEREQRVRGQLQPLREVARLVRVRVVVPRRGQRDDVQRQAAREHRREAGEPSRERVLRLRVGHRAREARLAVRRLEGQQLVAQPVDLRGDARGGGERRIAVARAPSAPIALSIRVSTSPQTRLLQKSYWSGPSIDATGTFAVASAGASVSSSESPCSGLSIAPTPSR